MTQSLGGSIGHACGGPSPWPPPGLWQALADRTWIGTAGKVRSDAGPDGSPFVGKPVLAQEGTAVDENQAIALVTRLVCRFRHLAASQVPPHVDLAVALGFDSLDAAELLAAIHRETGREVLVSSMDELRTIADVARCVADPAPAESVACALGAAP